MKKIIEVPRDAWRKSTRSAANGSCVMVAFVSGQVAVRNSKDDDEGAVLTFTADEWSAFVAGTKDGEFDR